jgi:hypothetical protein
MSSGGFFSYGNAAPLLLLLVGSIVIELFLLLLQLRSGSERTLN